MKTYAIHTLGCKVNQYESQQIRQHLEQYGLSACSRAHPADVVVVNTCCVTHIASSKSRQVIRKAHKARPDAAIIVTGCLPIGADSELKNLSDILIVKDKYTLPAVLDRLFGNPAPGQHTDILSKPLNIGKIKDKNGSLLQNNVPQSPKITSGRRLNTDIDVGSAMEASVWPGTPNEPMGILKRFNGQCRAFLKVQDGCDAYCTYCIIPKIRTKVCNKDVKSVQIEADNLVKAGHREIVLTGIFLGAYGQTTARRKKWEPGKADALAELTDTVAQTPGLERLRLSSLEPLDVTGRLLEVMGDHANIAPHLHLPLQAGSANVLRKMARQYTLDDYLRVVETVKSTFDRPAITTDIIVGFPGETDEDFQQTLDLAEQIGFAKIHVFSFSTRKNTSAEKMARLFSTVSPQVIKQRSSQLQQLDNELQARFRKACVGLHENVLIEKTYPLCGRAMRYFMVDLSDYPNAKNLGKGDTVNITLE